MKKGQLVVKVISGAGFHTATIERVAKVSKGRVRLQDCNLEYDERTGAEVDACIPGFSSKLVHFDDGEEARWGLK